MQINAENRSIHGVHSLAYQCRNDAGQCITASADGEAWISCAIFITTFTVGNPSLLPFENNNRIPLCGKRIRFFYLANAVVRIHTAKTFPFPRMWSQDSLGR